MPAVSNECIQNGSQSFPFSLSLFATAAASSLDNLFKFFTSQCVQFHCSILQLPFNRLYYTFIRQKKQHMTFSVILSVHHKYWLRLLCAYMFFLYFWRYYSFIETYSIRYDKTLLYIFMFRCNNILILSVLRRSNQTGLPFVFTWNILKIFIQLRITPAGAGKTVSSSASGQRGKDHPRGCGENFIMAE